jgi:hypothetical protein
MINYFNLERVVGRFDILSDNRDKEAWYQRIETFFNRSSPTEASE